MKLTDHRLDTLRRAAHGQLTAWGTVWQPRQVHSITQPDGLRLPGKFAAAMDWLWENGYVHIEWRGHRGPGQIIATAKGTAALEEATQ